jgi:ABC-2 type transport system permease protein
VIRGVANTAPFSPWSFGYYISLIMPLLVIALLFGLWTVFSPAARRAEAITSATPVDEQIYNIIKCGAALTAHLIIWVFVILMCLIFLKTLFGNAVSLIIILLPCVITAVPATIYFFGTGLLAGRFKRRQSVVIILLAVILAILPVPGYAALFDIDFYIRYPLTLGVLDPVFSLPVPLIAGKIVYIAIGVLFSVISFKINE